MFTIFVFRLILLVMKRLLVVFSLLFLSLGAWAQYSETQTSPLAEAGWVDYNQALEKARRGRNTGIGLVIGGGVAVVGGGAAVIIGLTTSVVGAAVGATVGSIGGQEGASNGAQQGSKAGDPLMTAGLIAAGAGLVATGVGIPLIVKNNRTLKQLRLGPTGNGVGLALVF